MRPIISTRLSSFFQNQILTPEQQAFDLTVVFGADVNAAQIADLAMQYPMTKTKKGDHRQGGAGTQVV